MNHEFINSLPDVLRPYVVPATLLHVGYLAPRLRQADKDEITASRGGNVADAMVVSLKSSLVAWTFLNPTSMMPQGMAGMTLHESGCGIPWALGIPFDRAATRLFLAVSPLAIEYMLGHVTYLVNYVDARNVSAMRWLKWAGFTLGENQPWGVEQKDFYKFSMWGDKTDV